jgi:DNA ligase D
VRVSNPDRVYFPARGETKLDLVEYYLAVGDGIVNALRERPCMLHRFPEGVAGEKVHQKRVPRGAPPWLETVRVTFPSYDRYADELCVTELAQVIWAVQMSTVEFHPWNSRRADTEKPDEWRIDLDPMPDCPFDTVRRVAHVAHEVLDELGAVGWPKTSGGNGIHVYVRIKPDWGFGDVRRAALAFAREVERRAPDLVTTTWWRKDRDPTKLFVDYNQNTRDHTIASAYSVRGNPEATVSTPIRWDEVDDVCSTGAHHRHRPRQVRRARRPPRGHRRRRLRPHAAPGVGRAGRGRRCGAPGGPRRLSRLLRPRPSVSDLGPPSRI